MDRREFLRSAATAGTTAALLRDTLAVARSAELAPVTETDVFVSGVDGYDTYRIPSVIKAPSGALLAFCEGRRDGVGDSGNIDLLLKRSDDGGGSWSRHLVVWDDELNTCGNPCAVVDQATGTIWLLLTRNLGVDRESQIIAGESRGTRTVWITFSTDDGRSWEAPREITGSVKRPSWTWYATGPGVGIQLERGAYPGRLVVPCDHIEAGTERYFSHVIYSDDHGLTWRLGGSSPVDQVNECQLVELSDGRLMLNMRNYDPARTRRAVCFSDDGGETWSGFTHDATLIEPICQASLVRYDWPNGGEADRLLFSNPASTEARVDMTVRLSVDGGATWPIARRLRTGPAAYSCLTVLADGRAGCLYESGAEHPYERITFAHFDLQWLSDTLPSAG